MAKHLRIFSLLLSLIGASIPIHAQGYGKGQALGALENGIYHNNLTGIELTIPPNWILASQQSAPSGRSAETASSSTTS